jgi:hypothetical protein
MPPCPQCGAEVVGAFKFCPHCGVGLGRSHLAPARAAAPPSATERARRAASYTPKHLVEKILNTRSALLRWRRGGDAVPVRATMRAALVVALLLAPAVALAQTTRVDLFDAKSRRQGYATIDDRTGRIDTYDVNSRRTGWGQVSPSGRVDFYGLDGQRQGYGTLTPSGAVRPEPRR